MVHPSGHYGFSNSFSKVVWVLLAMFLVWWTLRPVFFSKVVSSSDQSCVCDCDCNDQFASTLPPEYNYSSYADIINSTYADCGKQDPALSEELEKNMVALIAEEITLQKIVANDSLEHTQDLIKTARETSLHYQGEAEKCNVQVETCEEARERAEAQLVEERKLTELWEKRARDLG